ncbi:unnamed protein product [Phytophthora fragariaefolia]|uniref:Unnamed protein product n=1 Tax=Phytophthora fragariaefolia TaxID=1490495 RepID=A0A9W7CZN5_9STRA|nr:unnamed protein product [Phytophthora fragariaefolia]
MMNSYTAAGVSVAPCRVVQFGGVRFRHAVSPPHRLRVNDVRRRHRGAVLGIHHEENDDSSRPERLSHHEIPVVDNEATKDVVSGSQLRRFVRKHYKSNSLGGVDEDLGEKPQSDPPLMSWATLKDKLTFSTRTDNTGCFSDMGSIDVREELAESRAALCLCAVQI